MLGIVTGKRVSITLQHLDIDKRVPFRLDSTEDFAGQVACNAIGFYENESLLNLHVYSLTFCWWVDLVSALPVDSPADDPAVNPQRKEQAPHNE